MSAHRIPMLRGTTPFRDHFEYFITDGDETSVDPNLFPFTISVDDALRWLWRAKRWLVSGSASLSFDAATSSGLTGSANFTVTVTNMPVMLFLPNFNDERDFIRESLAYIVSNLGFDGSDSFPGGTYINVTGSSSSTNPDWSLFSTDLLGSADLSIMPSHLTEYWNGSGHQPRIGFSVSSHCDFEYVNTVDPLHPHAHMQRTLVLALNATGFLSPPTSFAPYQDLSQYTMDGYIAEMAGAHQVVDATYSNYNLTATDWNANIVEYWPYINRLGQQVWDTSTGTQLNDPLG